MNDIELHSERPVAIIDAEAHAKEREEWQARTLKMWEEIERLRAEIARYKLIW